MLLSGIQRLYTSSSKGHWVPANGCGNDHLSCPNVVIGHLAPLHLFVKRSLGSRQLPRELPPVMPECCYRASSAFTTLRQKVTGFPPAFAGTPPCHARMLLSGIQCLYTSSSKGHWVPANGRGNDHLSCPNVVIGHPVPLHLFVKKSLGSRQLPRERPPAMPECCYRASSAFTPLRQKVTGFPPAATGTTTCHARMLLSGIQRLYTSSSKGRWVPANGCGNDHLSCPNVVIGHPAPLHLFVKRSLGSRQRLRERPPVMPECCYRASSDLQIQVLPDVHSTKSERRKLLSLYVPTP